MSTIRKVIAFPRYVREMSARVDPLDLELEVLREINWQLNRLPDEASVVRCVQFLMEHRGYDLTDGKEIARVDDEV
jgi:hypothetical protein